MNLTDIARLRLFSQQLGVTTMNMAVDMVEWFAAVQGQEYAQAKWGLGLRLPHLKDIDIEQELIQGKILRTHLLRPTWHFVAAKDIHWLLALTAPRVHVANAFMYRQLELDKKFFTRCNKAIIKILEGCKQLTRNEINEALKKQKIKAEGLRLVYIMMNAELEGIICSGARRGNQFTYALIDEIVQQNDTFNKEEALTELTKRYFKSRGPATTKDFSTWSGLTIADCKKGISNIQHLLNKELIDGNEYYFTDVSTANKQQKKLYLLPIYDEFIMGYKNRDAIVQIKNSITGSVLSYTNMIVYDGQVIGTWTRTVPKNSIDLKYEFFSPLNKSQQKLFEQAVMHLEKFSGMKVSH